VVGCGAALAGSGCGCWMVGTRWPVEGYLGRGMGVLRGGGVAVGGWVLVVCGWGWWGCGGCG